MDTIGVLEIEVEAYQKIDLFVWIFFPIIIVLTILQFAFFTLYNGQFHHMSKILNQTNQSKHTFHVYL